MADPKPGFDYGGGGGAAGFDYAAGKRTSKPIDLPSWAKPGRKKGIIETITDVPGAFVGGLAHAALNAPAGVAQSLNATGGLVPDHFLRRSDFEFHPEYLRHPLRPRKDDSAKKREAREFVGGIATSFKETAEHPLRDPAMTFLNFYPLASGALRAGELARGVDITTPRIIKSGKAKVETEKSRSAVGRAVQDLYDFTSSSLAERTPGGKAEAFQQGRIGRIKDAEGRQAERVARGSGLALKYIGRKLDEGQQKALEVVAEQAPLEGRIQASQARAAQARLDGDEAQAAWHEGETGRLEAAAAHIDSSSGLPKLHDPKLQRIYDRMEKVAGDRTALLKHLGLLTDEAEQARLDKAGKIALGEHYVEPTPARLGIPSRAHELASQRVDRLTKLYDRATERRDKAAQKLIERLNTPKVRKAAAQPAPSIPTPEELTRPRTKAEAQARLAALEAAHDKAIEDVRLALFGKIGNELTRGKNMQRGKDIKANARANKALRKRGLGHAELKLAKTVKDEQLAAAEAWLHEQMTKLPPDHPVRVQGERQNAEIEALSKALSPDPEDLFPTAEEVAARKAAPERDYGVEPTDAVKLDRLRAELEAEQAKPKGPVKAGGPSPAKVKKLKAQIAELEAKMPAPEGAVEKPLWVKQDEALTAEKRRMIAELDATGADPNDSRYRAMWSSAARENFWGKGANLRADSLAFIERSEANQAKRYERWRQEQQQAPEAVAEAVAAPNPKREPAPVPAMQLGGKVLADRAVLTPPHGARTEHLGAALSEAKADLDRLEAARLAGIEPTGVVGTSGFEAGPGALRIPDVKKKRGSGGAGRQGTMGQQGVIGHQQPPGSVTHTYTGANREYGGRRQDTTGLVAESSLEVAKYAGMKHVYDWLQQIATDAPGRLDDIAIRMDVIGSTARLPRLVRELIADPEDFFHHATPKEASTAFQQLRERLFIPGHDSGGVWKPKQLDGEAQAEFQQLYQDGMIGWVPKRFLGDLANPAAPLRSTITGKTVGTIDAINNSSRFAILYLKPAYAIPNILGNAGLLLVQGFANPQALAAAAKLYHRIPGEDMAYIDAAVGEGLARSLSAHGAGPLAASVDWAASKWSRVVDTPFRRASFLVEANKAGHTTPKQIHDLLHRDPSDPELINVGIKANRNLIDYEALSPTEKEVIRRVVFFYPWVRGSTVYAGRFIREHPVQAAAVGQLGRSGQEYSESRLGPAPSYLEGLIPFGNNRAVNPNSLSVLATPATVASAVTGAFSGNIPQAAQATQFLTPALSLLLAAATRRDRSGFPYPNGTNAGIVAYDTLINSLPQLNLLRSLGVDLPMSHPSKLYPPSVESGVGQYTFGGVFPRRIDKARLNSLARAEAKRLGHPLPPPAATTSGFNYAG